MPLIRLVRNDEPYSLLDTFTWFKTGTEVNNVEIKVNVGIEFELNRNSIRTFLGCIFDAAQVGGGAHQAIVESVPPGKPAYKFHGECRNTGVLADSETQAFNYFKAARVQGGAAGGCMPQAAGGVRSLVFRDPADDWYAEYGLQKIGVNIIDHGKRNIEIKFGLPGAHPIHPYEVTLSLNVHVGYKRMGDGVLPHEDIDNAVTQFRDLIERFYDSAAGLVAGAAGALHPAGALDRVSRADLQFAEELEWDKYEDQVVAGGYVGQDTYSIAQKSMSALNQVMIARAATERRELFKMMADGNPVIAAKKDKALFEAAARGDLDAVKMWVEFGADVNSVQEHVEYGGVTPLFIAMKSGHRSVAKFLRDNGANQMEAKMLSKRANMHTLFAQQSHWLNLGGDDVAPEIVALWMKKA